MFFGFLYINAQLVLPLLYGLPKALWLWMRGKLKFGAVTHMLMIPTIVIFLLLFLGAVLSAWAPFVFHWLTQSSISILADSASILCLLGNALFSPTGRQNMAEDFDKSTFKYWVK